MSVDIPWSVGHSRSTAGPIVRILITHTTMASAGDGGGGSQEGKQPT